MGERRTIMIIGVSVIVAVALMLAWTSASNDHLSAGSLTEVTDKKLLESQIQLTGIGIETSESYVGHRIRVIHATIANTAGKPLRLVEVRMVFNDYDKKPIQESVEKVFDVTQKPLLPGSKYRFVVNFENLPRTWNYHIPDIEVVKAAY